MSVSTAFSNSLKLSLVFLELDRNTENMSSISFRKYYNKRKRKTTCLLWTSKCTYYSLCSRHHYITVHASSAFLSSYRNTILNQSARVCPLSYFLIHNISLQGIITANNTIPKVSTAMSISITSIVQFQKIYPYPFQVRLTEILRGRQKPKFLKESMKLSWNIQGGGVQNKKPSLGGVWILSPNFT